MAKILVIEDEKALNEAYQLVLERAGHEVKVAYDGQEALDILNDYKAELLLLDLRMPRMGGVEMLKRLKARKGESKMKILIFSNYDDPEEIDNTFKYGAHKYMLKAWSSPADLVKVVNEALKEDGK